MTESVKVYVGIDVSKDFLDVHLRFRNLIAGLITSGRIFSVKGFSCQVSVRLSLMLTVPFTGVLILLLFP